MVFVIVKKLPHIYTCIFQFFLLQYIISVPFFLTVFCCVIAVLFRSIVPSECNSNNEPMKPSMKKKTSLIPILSPSASSSRPPPQPPLHPQTTQQTTQQTTHKPPTNHPTNHPRTTHPIICHSHTKITFSFRIITHHTTETPSPIRPTTRRSR